MCEKWQRLETATRKKEKKEKKERQGRNKYWERERAGGEEIVSVSVIVKLIKVWGGGRI
jgi:hypothetical protein